MFQLVVGAIAGITAGSPGAVTANWANISETSTTGASGTSASTVTFTGGGTRDFTLEHDVMFGTLEVKVGSGSYRTVAATDTITVTTGQTVTFRYTCYFTDENATLTVTDDALATLVDTITLSFTFIS